jgi:hypothetical protein
LLDAQRTRCAVEPEIAIHASGAWRAHGRPSVGMIERPACQDIHVSFAKTGSDTGAA